MRPLLFAGALLLAGVGTAGGVYLAGTGGEEEVVQQLETATPSVSATPAGGTPSALQALTPGPGVTLWRWGNVTVLIPDTSDITAYPDTIYLDDTGSQSRPGLRVIKTDPDDSRISSYVLIDAEDATIFSQDIREEHQIDLELVLRTVGVSPFDSSTAPWPYNPDPPSDLSFSSSLGYHYPVPPRATGLYTYSAIADFGENAGGFVGIRNGRSVATVRWDRATGELAKDLSYVSPDERPVFRRWVDAVVLCSEEAPC